MHCIVELGPADLVAEGREGERGVKDDSHGWDISHCVLGSVILLSCGILEWGMIDGELHISLLSWCVR